MRASVFVAGVLLLVGCEQNSGHVPKVRFKIGEEWLTNQVMKLESRLIAEEARLKQLIRAHNALGRFQLPSIELLDQSGEWGLLLSWVMDTMQKVARSCNVNLSKPMSVLGIPSGKGFNLSKYDWHSQFTLACLALHHIKRDIFKGEQVVTARYALEWAKFLIEHCRKRMPWHLRVVLARIGAIFAHISGEFATLYEMALQNLPYYCLFPMLLEAISLGNREALAMLPLVIPTPMGFLNNPNGEPLWVVVLRLFPDASTDVLKAMREKGPVRTHPWAVFEKWLAANMKNLFWDGLRWRLIKGKTQKVPTLSAKIRELIKKKMWLDSASYPNSYWQELFRRMKGGTK